MQVFYRTLRRKACNLPVTYEQTSVKFCCMEIERQWGRLLGFGVRSHPRSTSHEVNLYVIHPQVSGFVLEVVPIGFCPFCGCAVKVTKVHVKTRLRPPNKTRTGGSGNKLEWRRV